MKRGITDIPSIKRGANNVNLVYRGNNLIFSKDLISYYNMNGNANDSYGSFNGTPSNNIIFSTNRTGKFGTAAEFDTDNSIDLGLQSGLDVPLTVSAWVYIDSYVNDCTIYALGSSGNLDYNGIEFYVQTTGRVLIQSGDNGGQGSGNRRTIFTATGLVPVGQWTHIAFYIENISTGKIYINGVAQTLTVSGTASTIVYTGNSKIGEGNWTSQKFARNSVIDDLAIWNRELSASEINAIYTSNRPLSGEFLPSNITNNILWLDADDPGTITEVSGGVDSWADKSGNGINFSAANATRRPTYNVNGFINFNGIDQGLTCNSNAILGSDTYSMFIVTKTNRLSVTQTLIRLFGGKNAAGDFGMFNLNSNKWNPHHRTNGGGFNGVISTTLVDTNKTLLVFESQPAVPALTLRYLTDTITGGDTDLYTLNSSTNISLGANITQADAYTLPYEGEVYEIILYKRVLTANERAQVENYLSNKWNITL